MIGADVMLELEFVWIGLGLAALGYFIGDGLKNFKNPKAKNAVESIFPDDDRNELIKESDLHWYIGIRKSDVRSLINNRSEEHTSELQSRGHLVCRLLLEKKKKTERDEGTEENTQCTNKIKH